MAELEATTVRKGNRKVSLQIYGQVSETIMWWDDGAEKNVYVQENNAVKNIVGFTGGAKINSDWSAGFKLELQIRSYRSSAANQTAFGENNGVTITTYNTQSVSLRHAYWELASRTYGTIRVGRDNDPTVGTSGINLANPDGFQSAGGFMGFANQGMLIRRSGTTGNAGLSTLTLGNGGYARNGDGPAAFDYAQTASMVKYISPFFLGQTKSSGFQVQAGWGQDDMWAAALRYVEDFGTFRAAAGFGYLDSRGLDRTECSNVSGSGMVANNPAAFSTVVGSTNQISATSAAASNGVSNVSCNMWQASGSLMHTPTGLYVSGGGAVINDQNRQKLLNLAQSNFNGGVTNFAGTPGAITQQQAKADKTDNFWWVQAGWEAKLNTLGKTTFYGTYAMYNIGTGVSNNALQTVASSDVLNSLGRTAFIQGNELKQWGIGVTQAVDAAAMNLYLGYINTSTTQTLVTMSGANGVGLATNNAKANSNDTNQVIYSGATIKF